MQSSSRRPVVLPLVVLPPVLPLVVVVEALPFFGDEDHGKRMPFEWISTPDAAHLSKTLPPAASNRLLTCTHAHDEPL
jgi:hypothetical protein